jgi:hypothetical protein
MTVGIISSAFGLVEDDVGVVDMGCCIANDGERLLFSEYDAFVLPFGDHRSERKLVALVRGFRGGLL